MAEITTKQLISVLKNNCWDIVRATNTAYLINQKIGTTNSAMLLTALQSIPNFVNAVQNELEGKELRIHSLKTSEYTGSGGYLIGNRRN